MTTDHTPPASFVLWLDASDGSVPTHDGVRWPDGTATLHHRHFGHTTTHPDPETARQRTHGKQGRIVWPERADEMQPGMKARPKRLTDGAPSNAPHACIEFDTWFDRAVCPDPCGQMHQRCTSCGAALDGCVHHMDDWRQSGANCP
ncbi:hypothetical protein ACFW2V_13290 [Streptomyces sp. NPDC058947]|uniref:hypothetical protein n=1 Tax=Streptomyces sp. NPDC058947 TaxID=3346675 RepID=UPI003673D7A0